MKSTKTMALHFPYNLRNETLGADRRSSHRHSRWCARSKSRLRGLLIALAAGLIASLGILLDSSARKRLAGERTDLEHKTSKKDGQTPRDGNS